jgi:hypothetical protein
MISSPSFEISMKHKLFVYFIDVLTLKGEKGLSPITQLGRSKSQKNGEITYTAAET